MEYKVTKNNIRIYDCYKAKRCDYVKVLNEIKSEYPDCEVWNRSMDSLKREWRVHAILYKLNLYVDHTKDVDLEYPIDKRTEMLFNIFGFLL